jgi:hypothetical protein
MPRILVGTVDYSMGVAEAESAIEPLVSKLCRSYHKVSGCRTVDPYTTDWRAELASRVETEIIRLQSIHPGGEITFSRTRPESFRISFADVIVTVLLKPTLISWTHARILGTNRQFVSENGSMEVPKDRSAILESALLLVDKLTENPKVH